MDPITYPVESFDQVVGGVLNDQHEPCRKVFILYGIKHSKAVIEILVAAGNQGKVNEVLELLQQCYDGEIIPMLCAHSILDDAWSTEIDRSVTDYAGGHRLEIHQSIEGVFTFIRSEVVDIEALKREALQVGLIYYPAQQHNPWPH